MDKVVVLFPSSLQLEADCGFLVGWNSSPSQCCVAAIVCQSSFKELTDVCTALNRDYKECKYMNEIAGAEACVLGEVYRDKQTYSKLNRSSARIYQQYITDLSFWLELVYDDDDDSNGTATGLDFLSLSLNGLPQQGLNVQMIFYRPTDSFDLQFYSIYSMSLDVDLRMIVQNVEAVGSKESVNSSLQSLLEAKVLSHAYDGDMEGGQSISDINHNSKSNDFSVLIAQANCSNDFRKMLTDKCKEMKLDAIVLKGRQNLTILYLARSMILQFISSIFAIFGKLVRLFKYPVSVTIMILRVICEIIILVINFQIGNSISLVSLSNIARQINLRLQQACFWPWQYAVFLRPGWRKSVRNRAHYINFYNTVWLVANDVIMGIAFGTFIYENRYQLTKYLSSCLHFINHDVIENAIGWLMGWPAGLKLNDNLDKFIGELFLWLLQMWIHVLDKVLDLMPQLLGLVGMSGVFGCTMILAIAADLSFLLNLHIVLFYTFAAKIYNWQLQILYSLFNLFRGRKFNALRLRLDSCDYDLDQLLLGTILFTLFSFLYPTVIVYYVLFCVCRVVSILYQVVIKIFLAFLNHFPLFALMLRVKDPSRLPGGIWFKFLSESGNNKMAQLNEVDEDEELYLRRASAQSSRTHSRQSSRSGGAAVGAASITQDRALYNMTPSLVYNMQRHRNTWNKIQKMKLCNNPISVVTIFYQYKLLLKQLSEYYPMHYVIMSLLYGEPIKSSPNLQYPNLPDDRPSMQTYWSFLISLLSERPSLELEET
ncbi:hypothetical protein MIR68_012219 [Amoeboaphelidium protococcarum]|nr:hypothetical protein MIR68_012219 [Amoeboaphelidium protococcarum]